MQFLSKNRNHLYLQIGLIVLAFIVSIITPSSYLFYNSPFSPLLVMGLILGLIFAWFWVRTPVIALYTVLLVILLPLGLFPASIQSNLNRFLTVVALAAWVLPVIIQQRRIVFTKPALFMLGFLIWCLLTLLWAQNLEAAKNVLGGYTLRFVLFLILIANEINTRKTLDGLMHTLSLAGWVYIVAGIFTLVIQGYEIGTRLQILEANENTIGVLFPIFVVGVIWLAVRTPNPRRGFWIFLSFAFVLISFVLIALSGSRGGAITWIITMLILLFWRQTRLWGIFGLLILISTVIIAPLILSTTFNRFLELTEDKVLGGREALWQAATLLIRDRPFTGVGVGNAPYEMMTYIRMFRSVLGRDSASTHNPILAVWVDVGLPGLLLYLGVLVSAIYSFIIQYIQCRKSEVKWLLPYFVLVVSAFCGFFASWIKGGGMELSQSYFLMLALLLIPSCLNNLSSTNLLSEKCVN